MAGVREGREEGETCWEIIKKGEKGEEIRESVDGEWGMGKEGR